MDKKAKQAIAIALAVIILFAGGYFIGIGKSISIGVSVNSGNAASAGESVTPSTAAPATQASSTAAPATEATAAPQASSDSPSTPDVTQSEQPTAAPADNSGSSMTTEQIVELYNKSVNRVKQEAKQINRNYNHVSIPEETLELPSAIQGIGKTAINTFVKPDDTVQEWTTADDFKLGFPVSGEDYSSHMTADMVESATCKDSGDTYQLEIVLKDDAITNPAKGEGYAGVFNTTTASTFEDISIPTVTFNEVKINGIDGSISATIDKATETVKDITFRNTDIMYLNVKVAFSTLEAKMNLVQEANYTIIY